MYTYVYDTYTYIYISYDIILMFPEHVHTIPNVVG